MKRMVKTVCQIVFITILALVGCSQEQQKETEVVAQEVVLMEKIVAVGDSLTAGLGLDENESYPAVLEEKLQTAGYQYQVINAGVSGETSSGTLSRMEWILTLDPDIVILEIGANDGLRGVDPQVTEDNIRQMLQLLEESGVEVVLVGMKMVRNLGPAYVARFDRIYPDLAEEFEVVFFPFFLEGVAMVPDLNQSDGIHPNAQGYAVIVDNMYPYITEVIERSKKNE